MKSWISKAMQWLDRSLGKVPGELNEIDWKGGLSPYNDKLRKHIAAFANLPGGGFLTFGVDNHTGNKLPGQEKMSSYLHQKLDIPLNRTTFAE